ncbi:flavin reductase family protein [Parapedomonas caeni]
MSQDHAAEINYTDTQAFKRGMRQLTGAVCIITADHAGARAGLTATAVCSVCAEPPRLLVGINRAGRSYALVRDAGAFCVNVLAEDGLALAQRFAMPVEGLDERFATGGWEAGVTGSPVLPGALAAFECRVHDIVEVGTHGMVIGDVVAVRTNEAIGPLLYMNGQFGSLMPLAG